MEDDLFMMALFSREGEGGQFFCIDDANLAGEPLKCPGGYHTGEQGTRQSLMMVINNFWERVSLW